MKDGSKDATKTSNPNVGTRIWSNRIHDQHDGPSLSLWHPDTRAAGWYEAGGWAKTKVATKVWENLGDQQRADGNGGAVGKSFSHVV